MKISMKSPGWNATTIETEQHTIIQEAYCGPIFITKEGVCLSVCMRDDGYEVSCWREAAGYIPGPFEALPNDAIMFSVDTNTGLKLLGENPQAGAWFVYAYDTMAYPIAIFDNELDACRLVINKGYGSVLFWPFGLEWEDAVSRSFQ